MAAALLAALLALMSLASAAEVPLLTFDGAASHPVRTVNDPVMGGGSESHFKLDEARALGVWEGVVKVVSFLGKPGFCTLRTAEAHAAFPDASGTHALELRLRGASGLAPFSLQVGIAGITESQSVYAAAVSLRPGAQSVRVPWADFRLSRRGKQMPGPPLADHLDKIDRVGLGTSGVAGAFALEIEALVAVAE